MSGLCGKPVDDLTAELADLIYNKPQTDNDGVFIQSGEARPDPLEPGKYLMPRNSTAVAPPEFGEKEIPVRDENGWVVQPDFRGETGYDPETGAEVEIEVIGPWPENLANEPKPGPEYDWDGQAWRINEDKQKEMERRRILGELAALDAEGARAAQELLDTSTPEKDRAFSESKLKDLNRNKAELRAELAALE